MKKIISNIKKATSHKSIVQIIFEIIIHKLLINTSPTDYLHYCFYKDEKSMEEKSRYIGFKGSKYFPYENNPLKYNRIFINKYIQKKIINHLSLPTANLISAIGEKYEISTQKQLHIFLGSIEKDIVIKPISGSGGSGFLLISPKGENYLVGDRLLSKDDIWFHLVGNLRNFKKGYLIEEKIINTDSIRSLYPVSLNSYRVIMIKTNDNKWHNPCCYLKIGRGGEQVDNLQIFVVSDSSGKSTSAYDYTQSRPITHHPDTMKPLVGIKLDGFKEVIDLSFKASKKLSFMGALGWDIAFTDNGPFIVEVNAWWDNYRPQIAMGKGMITDVIAKGLKKKNIYSNWDKTCMYPRSHIAALITLLKRNYEKHFK